MANYFCGCDVGTSGTKACIMNEEGVILGTHYIEYKLYTPHPSWAEHDPEDYWKAVAGTIKASIQKANVDPAEIRGVSISALSPGCILVDKDLKPLQYSHIWMDRRGVKQSLWLKEHIGDERVFQVSANPIDPYYGVVKLMWERDNRPELYKKAYKMQNTADYPVMKLTGKAVTDFSNAALDGIAFDMRKKVWDTAMLEEIGLDPDKLPEAYACDEIVGEVTKEAAEATGLKAGTPVLAGSVDCNMAYLANGALENGDWSLTMGTAGCMGVIHTEPKFPRNMIIIPHPSDSRNVFASVGATIACGSCTRYFRDTFAQYERAFASDLGLNVYDIMNLEAAKVPVGSEGMIILPYFSGERTPIWSPNARAVVFGMSLKHTRGHFLRALMEGAALALYDNYVFMKEAGIYMKEPMVVSEGGAQSDLWRQIVADIFGVPVAYQKTSRGAPEGNCVAVGVVSGVYKDYTVARDWVKIDTINEPNMANHELYMELFGIYKKVYEGVKDQFDPLARIVQAHA